MRYRLFYINFKTCGIRATNHTTLKEVRKTAERIIREECSRLEDELPSIRALEKYLDTRGEYTGYLMNGNWFHIERADMRGVTKCD